MVPDVCVLNNNMLQLDYIDIMTDWFHSILVLIFLKLLKHVNIFLLGFMFYDPSQRLLLC